MNDILIINTILACIPLIQSSILKILIIFENITQRRKHQVQAQQNFSRINVKLVGDTQTMYYNHGLS